VFDRLGDLVSEHAELEHALADPGVHSDQEKARTLGRRYAELTPIVHAYPEWQQTSADEQTARELGREDSSLAEEAEQLAAHREELEAQLQKLLVPRDPNEEENKSE
jgi:peptide chain release factor 1